MKLERLQQIVDDLRDLKDNDPEIEFSMLNWHRPPDFYNKRRCDAVGLHILKRQPKELFFTDGYNPKPDGFHIRYDDGIFKLCSDFEAVSHYLDITYEQVKELFN